jgi:major vault protein
LLIHNIEELKAEVEAVVAKAQAVSPQLLAALQNFSDKALAGKMAETMAPLAILGGESIAGVFGRLLKGTALEKVLLGSEAEKGNGKSSDTVNYTNSLSKIKNLPISALRIG